MNHFWYMYQRGSHRKGRSKIAYQWVVNWVNHWMEGSKFNEIWPFWTHWPQKWHAFLISWPILASMMILKSREIKEVDLKNVNKVGCINWKEMSTHYWLISFGYRITLFCYDSCQKFIIGSEHLSWPDCYKTSISKNLCDNMGINRLLSSFGAQLCYFYKLLRVQFFQE